MASLRAGQTVLAPTAELAAALYDAVERHHRDAGEAVWPTPRIRDFGSWLREHLLRRQLEDAAAPRCLTANEEAELWRNVVLQSPLSREFLEPAGAVRAAWRARRALYEYGIPRDAVAASGTDEARVLLQWDRDYAARCRALGCIGRDDWLGHVAQSPEPVAFIESPIWRPVALRWLQAHGRRMLLPVAASAPARGLAHPAATPGDELAAAAAWARENLLADAGFRAWICIPDLSLRRAEVVDAFDAALAPQRFASLQPAGAASYAAAGGTPLAEYAPVRAALRLLAASLGRVDFDAFSDLLRAPEYQSSAADAARAARLDVELRSRAPSDADIEAWLALSERIARAQDLHPVTALARLAAAVRALRQLRGNQPLSGWIAVWVGAFDQGPWAERLRWSSADFQAAERLRELLAELASGDVLFGAQSRQAAQGMLFNAAQNTDFQPQTGIPPIWISGRITDPWLTYDALWIGGAAEERWPAPAAPIPMLPPRLQAEYGVVGADAASQMQFARRLQERWRLRAPVCVFSYAAAGESAPPRPSPLLPADLLPMPAAADSRPHWGAARRQAPALERFVDELAPPFGGDERTRGTATLRAQSRCAFRGFAHTRLDAAALERPTPGFNDRERGILVHAALEAIWSSLGTSAALAAIPAAGLQQLIDAAAAAALQEVCARRDPGARWRSREALRLRQLLGNWLDCERQRQPFEVERIEQGRQAARHAGLEFSVRLDRVDRLADGARILIDYKTGIASADWRGDRPDNPQLPIYALLRREDLVAVAYGQVNARDCRFVFEAERGGLFKPSGRASPMEGVAGMAALLDLWSQRVERLAADFAAGWAEVAPTATACRSCHLHALCRIKGSGDDLADGDD